MDRNNERGTAAATTVALVLIVMIGLLYLPLFV